MKGYCLSVTAWVSNQREPETQTIKLTEYHSTVEGAEREFKNKYGKHVTFRELSEKLKVSIPTDILDKPNKIKVETIDIIEDSNDK